MNGNLFDYRVPRTTDLPELRTVIVERGDGVGAVRREGRRRGRRSTRSRRPSRTPSERAAGIRLREAPFTPERVWRALRERDAARLAATTPGAADSTEDAADSTEDAAAGGSGAAP